jgi:hypothetical protein
LAHSLTPWLAHAGFVVGLHDGRQQRVRPQRGPHRLRSDPAAGGDREVGDLEAVWLQHRLVLDGGGEDVPLALLTPAARKPRMARLLLSVAPLVKITSSRWAATTAAT